MPLDGRPYIVVTDEMPEHEKIEALSDQAFRALVTLWCRAHRLNTDGRVTAVSWAKIPEPVRDELLAAPLALEHEDGSASMRHYLEHNQSAAAREEGRAKKRLAGAKGGHARAAAIARAKASAVAPAKAPAQASAQQVLKQNPGRPVAEGEVEGEVEEDQPLNPSPAAPPRQLGLVPDADPFDEWWDVYPRHDDKKKAQLAYAKAVRRASVVVLHQGALTYAGAVAGKAKNYVLLPTTWLNGDRWNDELAPATPADRFGVGYGDADREGPSRAMSGAEWLNDPRSTA